MVNDASMFMENKQVAIKICVESKRKKGSLPKDATALGSKKQKQLRKHTLHDFQGYGRQISDCLCFQATSLCRCQ